MSRNIAVRFQSEPGWKAVSYERSEEGQIHLILHHVGGWGLEGIPALSGSFHLIGVPLSFGGQVLSDLPHFLGVLAPNDNLEEKMVSFQAVVEKAYEQGGAPASFTVSSD